MSNSLFLQLLLLLICTLSPACVSGAASVSPAELCNDLEHSCRLNRFHAQLSIVNETLATKYTKKDFPVKFDTVSGGSYSATFEQFILKNRLFKGKFDGVSSQSDPNFVEVLKTSERMCEEFCAPAEAYTEPQLKNVGDKIVVPRIAANNYLRRKIPGSDPGILRNSPYFKQWPAVRHVHAERPSRAMQCPANMHMVAWHYAAPGATLTVRAFPLGPSASYFQSRLFHDPTVVTNGSPFTGHFTSFLKTGFPDHVDGEVPAEDVLPPYAETDVASSHNPGSPGEYVFVPSSHVASFRCNAAESCPVVAVCFVDASNLNQFRDFLFFAGPVGAPEAALYSALMEPAFDAELPKNPADVSFETYLDAPVASDAAASGAAPPGAVEGGSPPPVASSSNRRDRRKKQTGGGGGNGADFKDWQELSRWRMLMTSLTIQKPATPTVLAVGRQQATLTWKSAFVPALSDKTAFGFKVVFCPINHTLLQEQMYLPIDSDGADVSRAGCESQSFYRGVEGGGLEESVDEAHLRHTGETALLFRAAIAGLQPDTQYQLRLGVLYDQRGSPLSSFTAPIRTATVSAPSPPLGIELPVGHLPPAEPKVLFFARTKGYKTGTRLSGELQFVWPEDDGGLPIVGFHVYRRAVPVAADARDLWQVADQPWQWVGAFPARRDTREKTNTIELLNLQPFGNIQFAIAAYNSLGSSAKSTPSEVAVIALAGPHVVHGWGHEHFLGELSHEYLTQHAHIHSGPEAATAHGAAAIAMLNHGLTAHCESDLVFLDGERQQLHGSADHCFHTGLEDNVEVPKFEMWRAHWSPSLVSILAKPAVATPTVSAVLFGGTLFGKIVFVLRGDIPFTEKAVLAQRWGASALVVVDDGKCVNYDQQCLPGSSKDLQEGFGAHDIKSHWQRVHIPVYFLLKSEAEKFAKYAAFPLIELMFSEDTRGEEL